MYDTYMIRISVDRVAEEAFTNALLVSGQSVQLPNLLTRAEKIKIGRRLLIARAILAGKTRMEINEKLQVSPNTFAQIRRWVESEFTEYSAATRIDTRVKGSRQHYPPYSFTHLRKTYPGHFLLFTLTKELFKKN